MRPSALACLTATASLVVIGLAACSGGHDREAPPPSEGTGTTPSGAEGRGGTLSVKGSDTMVILSQHWAEAFMRAHPGATVQVSGGGSGTGIAALLAGTADIANASRAIEDRERETMRRDRSLEMREMRVALDAVAVYVHPDNPIASLTLAQLAGIYRGQITRWSEVGGPDRPIVLYSRENNSGTYAYFKERVLDDADFAATAQTLPGTAAVIHAVAQDPTGIGYGGIGYAQEVRTVPLADEGGEPIAPTLENATTGRYPLARPLFMVTAGAPSGLAAEFIEFATSAAGQALVERAGFYPLPEGPGGAEAQGSEPAAPAPSAPGTPAPSAGTPPPAAEQ